MLDQSPQPVLHFTRQTVEVIISEKNNSSAPVIIAPMMLVATNSIASRMTDVRIVPKIPTSKVESGVHVQAYSSGRLRRFGKISAIARYTTAIPNKTHKNAGVVVMTAVKRRNAVIIPIMMLATMESPVQLLLQPQLKLPIIIHLQL